MSALRRGALALVVVGVLALAVLGLLRAVHPAAPPALQDRVDAVASTLRCPTCAGLSVADSSSVLAAGSRDVIRQQLQQGRTPDQIRQWFVDRYGAQVLLSPPPSGPGLLAWLLPALAVPAAGVLVWRWTRRGGAAEDPAARSADPVAGAALAAWRAGRLDPDRTPAGDALHAALLARVAAEEDGDADAVARADQRLAAAHRRWTARTTPAPSRPAAAPAGSGQRVRSVARRPLAVGAAAVLGATAVTGVVLALHARGAGQPLTGSTAVAAAASSGPPSAAPSSGPPGAAGGPVAAAAPSPPPGWTGGMPQTADQWVALGRAYDHAGQLTQAVAAYGMALRLQPGADDVLLLRADALVRSGRAATALPDLEQLGQRHPDSPDVLLILGLAQNRTGSAAATGTLQRFLQLDPGSPAAPGVRTLLGVR